VINDFKDFLESLRIDPVCRLGGYSHGMIRLPPYSGVWWDDDKGGPNAQWLREPFVPFFIDFDVMWCADEITSKIAGTLVEKLQQLYVTHTGRRQSVIWITASPIVRFFDPSDPEDEANQSY
jgi:hypothetical protein